MTTNDPSLESRCLHAGYEPEAAFASLNPPIYQTTTYAQAAPNQTKGFAYSRSGNPTVRILEERLAALEGTPLHAMATSTGMSSILLLGAATLKAGDEVVIGDCVYGGTVRLFRNTFAKFGVNVRFTDTSDAETLKQAISSRTRLLLIETPANPTLKITDIRQAADIIHDAGGLLAVDNTFLSPVLQRPFEHDADVIIHSTTKYIDGHNATVGGALLTRDEDLHARLLFDQNSLGVILSPFDAWLTLQGLKTLPLRIRQQSQTAHTLATRLARHPAIERVHYPGLSDFAGHDVARRQQDAWGAILSFEPKGGYQAAHDIATRVRLWRLAENLGAVESLLTHPASMTHASVPAEHRARVGITDGLIRLSVGLETEDELWAALEATLVKEVAPRAA
jgi:cystathionine beta-lyase/cystathionine gamma-synthase